MMRNRSWEMTERYIFEDDKGGKDLLSVKVDGRIYVERTYFYLDDVDGQEMFCIKQKNLIDGVSQVVHLTPLECTRIQRRYEQFKNADRMRDEKRKEIREF